MGAARLVRNYPLIANITITEQLFLSGWWRTVQSAPPSTLGEIGLGTDPASVGQSDQQCDQVHAIRHDHRFFQRPRRLYKPGDHATGVLGHRQRDRE